MIKNENTGKNLLNILDNVETRTKWETGETIHEGRLSNLHIKVFSDSVRIRGSLGVFHLGSNLQTLTQRDTAYGIEHLSDTLHLDISSAKITRIDFGTNLILNNPFSEYMAFLGEFPRHTLNSFGAGKKKTFTFSNRLRQLRFYDKIREIKDKRGRIQDEWIGLNVCRYETSYFRPARDFKIPSITGKMLSDPQFFSIALQRWLYFYTRIPKLTKLKLMTDIPLETIHDLNRLAMIHLAQDERFYSILMSELERRDLTKSQRSRLKSKMRESRINRALTVADDRINELDQKVYDAVRIYQP